jgi:NAD+ kinase
VILEDTIAEVLPGHGLQTSTRKLLGEVCDLVIVVGGDGSLLGAARALARHNIPVLGINRGSLGFLTDIRPDELEQKVAEVLDGHYLVENRFLLQAEVRRHHEAIGQGDALNDVVLHPGKSTRMIEFEIYIDGQFVCSQKADGLIVATPPVPRLCAVRRRPDHAPQARRHRDRADVPAHPVGPADRGRWQQRAENRGVQGHADLPAGLL